MKTEKEIRDSLNACFSVSDFGMSKGPCPFNEEGDRGCCAECSAPSTLMWVLGGDGAPNKNGQDALIDIMDGKAKQ